MIKIAIGILIIFVLLLTLRMSYVGDKRISINHYTMFSIGFLFYYITPIIVGEYDLFYGNVAMDNWHSIYDKIDNKDLVVYLLFSFCLYICLNLFSYFGERASEKKITLKSSRLSIEEYNEKSFMLLYIINLVVIGYFIYSYREFFLRGYNSELILDVSKKGPFIAVSQVMLCLSLFRTSIITEGKIKYSKIMNSYFITYILTSFFILSLGGRLYFITGVFALIIFLSRYELTYRIDTVFILSISLIILMGFIGVWRASYLSIDIENIAFNIFQEPLYTSFSLIDFLKTRQYKFLEYTGLLFRELFNLVPSFILPNKLEYIPKPVDYGYIINNPMGALHSFVSLSINFGLLGSIAMISLFGFFLGYIKNINNKLYVVIYSLVSSHIAFTFFRDGFVTSVVKNIIQFSLIVPLTIFGYLGIQKVILKYIKKMRFKKRSG